MVLPERPELTPEEKKLPLAKYYNIPLSMPDPLIMQIVNAGPMNPEDAIKPENFLELMMDPGVYGKVELGYCMMSDGSGYIAVYKRSEPRVTAEMSRWYLKWMNYYSKNMVPGQGNLRYKIWMPIDHIDHNYVNGKDNKDGVYSLETLDMGAGSKAIGSVHHRISEDDYGTFGVTPEMLSEYKAKGCNLRIAWESFDVPGSHFCCSVSRPCPLGGYEELSREWIGFRPENGKLVRDEFAPANEEYLKNVIIHNIIESNHMGKFLPQLYAEYKDLPLDAD